MCPIAHVETDSASGCVDTKMDGQLANPVCYTRIGKAEILGFSLDGSRVVVPSAKKWFCM
jgi:hypothetical protein